MSRVAALPIKKRKLISFDETVFRKEFLRKSIHMLIALVPFIASFSRVAAMVLLASGVMAYSFMELMRVQGQSVAFISSLTSFVSRDRDKGHFVLGPVTLGVGAMGALLLYPMPVAAIAIYALAFGDGFSSLVGRLFGKIKVPFLQGKTLEGSIACFLAVFIAAFKLTNRIPESMIIALGATLLEAIPSGDMDNILIPVGTGYLALLVVS